MHFLGIHFETFWEYYLVFCSFLAISLFLERCIFFITLKPLPKLECQHIQKALSEGRYPDECPRIKSSALKEALSLVFTHQNQNKDLQKEVMDAWFENHKKEIFLRLKWLNLVALAALLGGILASVLGFIQSIDILSSLNPHDFMRILKQSLYHLAIGMLIAFPSFIFAKALRIWGSFYLSSIRKSIQMLLFSIENHPLYNLQSQNQTCPFTGKKGE